LTQGENVNPCPRKKTKKRKFPIKDQKKEKEEKFSMKIGRKQKKERKIPDQTSEENKRNMQKGIWTRQYLNNTELSPPNKERKETST